MKIRPCRSPLVATIGNEVNLKGLTTRTLLDMYLIGRELKWTEASDYRVVAFCQFCLECECAVSVDARHRHPLTSAYIAGNTDADALNRGHVELAEATRDCYQNRPPSSARLHFDHVLLRPR